MRHSSRFSNFDTIHGRSICVLPHRRSLLRGQTLIEVSREKVSYLNADVYGSYMHIHPNWFFGLTVTQLVTEFEPGLPALRVFGAESSFDSSRILARIRINICILVYCILVFVQ